MLIRSLNNVIELNGGYPVKEIEDFILPIFLKDFALTLNSINGIPEEAKVSFFKWIEQNDLPEGWLFCHSYQKNPHLYLQYCYSEPNNSGEAINVFISSCSTRNEPSSQRGLYIMDIPLLPDEIDRPGDFCNNPFNLPAAWLTLMFYDERNIKYSIKKSHDVTATIQVSGEVKYNELL